MFRVNSRIQFSRSPASSTPGWLSNVRYTCNTWPTPVSPRAFSTVSSQPASSLSSSSARCNPSQKTHYMQHHVPRAFMLAVMVRVQTKLMTRKSTQAPQCKLSSIVLQEHSEQQDWYSTKQLRDLEDKLRAYVTHQKHPGSVLSAYHSQITPTSFGITVVEMSEDLESRHLDAVRTTIGLCASTISWSCLILLCWLCFVHVYMNVNQLCLNQHSRWPVRRFVQSLHVLFRV